MASVQTNRSVSLTLHNVKYLRDYFKERIDILKREVNFVICKFLLLVYLFL